MKYFFTKSGYAELEEAIKRNARNLKIASDDKNESGAGQDTWHDEGFKNGLMEEMMWQKNLERLENIRADSVVINVEEQKEVVKIGNGVLIEYDDGSKFAFILDGYSIESGSKRISTKSPLGKVILRAKEGDIIYFSLEGGEKRNFTVKEIMYPSEAENRLRR